MTWGDPGLGLLVADGAVISVAVASRVVKGAEQGVENVGGGVADDAEEDIEARVEGIAACHCRNLKYGGESAKGGGPDEYWGFGRSGEEQMDVKEAHEEQTVNTTKESGRSYE